MLLEVWLLPVLLLAGGRAPAFGLRQLHEVGDLVEVDLEHRAVQQGLAATAHLLDRARRSQEVFGCLQCQIH